MTWVWDEGGGAGRTLSTGLGRWLPLGSSGAVSHIDRGTKRFPLQLPSALGLHTQILMLQHTFPILR